MTDNHSVPEEEKKYTEILRELHLENRFKSLRTEIWKLASQPIQNEISFFYEAFRILGQEIQPSRISLNRFNRSNESYIVCEWLKPGSTPSPDILLPEDLWRFFYDQNDVDYITHDMLISLCEQNETITKYCSLIKEGLREADIENFIYFTFRVNNNLDGYFVFDWCKKEGQDRQWNKHEIEIGIEFARIISGIIENYRSKRRLLESEEHYKSLLENAGDYAIFRLKTTKNQLEPNIQKISPSLLSFLGLDDKQVYSFDKWLEKIHSDDRGKIISAIQLACKKPYRFNEFFRVNHPEKGIQWLHMRFNGIENIYGELEYFNGLITAGTPENEAMHTLSRIDEKIKQLVFNLSDPFLCLKELIISDLNEHAEILFGQKKEELINHPFIEFTVARQKNGADSSTFLSQKIVEAIECGYINFDLVILNKKGEQIDHTVYLLHPYNSGSGTVYAMLRPKRSRLYSYELEKKEGIQLMHERIKLALDRIINLKNNLAADPEISYSNKQNLEEIDQNVSKILAAFKEYSQIGQIEEKSEFSIPADISRMNIPDWHEKTILIVEDEEANYYFLFEALRKTKINIIWAKDGKDAIEKFRRNAVNAVLMDIQLPVLDGYKSTEIIKALNRNIPIIAQTAYAMPEDREKCFAAGCDEYLTKPIKSKKLISVLTKYL
ncbi:MAG TPA: hypothetical protein DEA97_05240 [Bacteroidales bacterium]|nr:hypothetical protein [Bacteroidales bacterium]